MPKTERAAKTSHQSKEVIDTVKALIEVYKSAFDDSWDNAFTATVRVEVSSAM